jgi:hypothetical protein
MVSRATGLVLSKATRYGLMQICCDTNWCIVIRCLRFVCIQRNWQIDTWWFLHTQYHDIIYFALSRERCGALGSIQMQRRQ